MRTTPRTIEQMQFYSTAYEVIWNDNGKITRLGFTERKNKNVLITMARTKADEIIARMAELEVDDQPFNKACKKLVWNIGKGLTICFSGRTERECANANIPIVRDYA